MSETSQNTIRVFDFTNLSDDDWVGVGILLSTVYDHM